MCAVAYAMLLDEIRRRVDIERQAALMAQMFGAHVEMPDEDKLRRRLDEMLCRAPAREAAMMTRIDVLREAMGLGRR